MRPVNYNRCIGIIELGPFLDGMLCSFSLVGISTRSVLPLRRLPCVEPPLTLFDAASPLVPRDDDPDMVRASAFACSGDFLLCLAGCQGKDLVAQTRRT